MEQWEKDKLNQNRIKESKVYSYLKEKRKSGEITTLTDFDMDCIINGKNIYDDKMNMKISSLDDLWDKIPSNLQKDIISILND